MIKSRRQTALDKTALFHFALKAKRMMTDTPSTDKRSCSRHLTRRSRTRRRLRYRFFDANDINGWACSPPHVAGGQLRLASVPD
jgi:hypothetical protein